MSAFSGWRSLCRVHRSLSGSTRAARAAVIKINVLNWWVMAIACRIARGARVLKRVVGGLGKYVNYE